MKRIEIHLECYIFSKICYEQSCFLEPKGLKAQSEITIPVTSSVSKEDTYINPKTGRRRGGGGNEMSLFLISLKKTKKKTF